MENVKRVYMIAGNFYFTNHLCVCLHQMDAPSGWRASRFWGRGTWWSQMFLCSTLVCTSVLPTGPAPEWDVRHWDDSWCKVSPSGDFCLVFFEQSVWENGCCKTLWVVKQTLKTQVCLVRGSFDVVSSPDRVLCKVAFQLLRLWVQISPQHILRKKSRQNKCVKVLSYYCMSQILYM